MLAARKEAEPGAQGQEPVTEAAPKAPAQQALMPCEYRTGRTLGQGSYAIVKECVKIATGERFACKIISKSLMRGKEFMILNEIAILERISHGHPNVVTLYSYFESPRNLYLVLDLCHGGELFEHLCERGAFYETDAAAIVRVTVSAVAYLHSRNVVHRDIKPENLLFRERPDPQQPLWRAARGLLLADFGLSKIMDPEKFATFTCLGTPGYIPPEVVRRSGHSKPADMWSVGVLCYFLLAGFTPFDADFSVDEVSNILAGRYAFEPAEVWDSVSPLARDFIARLLVVDPAGRLSADQALQHPWLMAVEPLLPQPVGTLSEDAPTPVTGSTGCLSAVDGSVASAEIFGPGFVGAPVLAVQPDSSVDSSVVDVDMDAPEIPPPPPSKDRPELHVDTAVKPLRPTYHSSLPRRNLLECRPAVLATTPPNSQKTPERTALPLDNGDIAPRTLQSATIPRTTTSGRRVFGRLVDAVRSIHGFARHPILSHHRSQLDHLPATAPPPVPDKDDRAMSSVATLVDSEGSLLDAPDWCASAAPAPTAEAYRSAQALARSKSLRVAEQLLGQQILPVEDGI